MSNQHETVLITGATIYADGGRLALNYTVDVAGGEIVARCLT